MTWQKTTLTRKPTLEQEATSEVRLSLEGPIKNFCKLPAIWVHINNESFPLVYLQQPKWLSPNQWDVIFSSLRLQMTASQMLKLLENQRLSDMLAEAREHVFKTGGKHT